MKKINSISIMVLSLILITGAGCANSESNSQAKELLEAAQKDNEQLMSKLKQQEQINQELQRQLDDVKKAQAEVEARRTIVFDGQVIQIGDTIRDFKVTDIEFGEGDYESAVLEKEFTLKGELVLNMIGGSKYSLRIDKEEFVANLPNPHEEMLEWRDYVFVQLQGDQIAEEGLGEARVKKLDESLDQGETYLVTVKLNKFTYRFLPESDMSSSVDLVELMVD